MLNSRAHIMCARFCVREIAHDCNSCGRMCERDVSGQNDETICTDQKKAVPLHRISKTAAMKYRDPHVYLYDLEEMTGKSRRTAQRIMVRVREKFGLGRFERPTLQQVKAYLECA